MSFDVELTANIHLEDEAYWADIPELPGCFAAGETLDELFSSLKEGIELYLQEGERTPLDRPLQVRSAVLSDASA